MNFTAMKHSYGNIAKTVRFSVDFAIRRPLTKDKKKFAKWLKQELIDLGPSYIKIGQFISTRSDIFEKEITNELQTLQDDAPPFDSDDAKVIISKELGVPWHDVFEEFEDVPIASASISQVHRARLKDTGEHVVVKVQRPFIREMFDKDFKTLDALLNLASIAENRGVNDTKIILDSSYASMYDELSFTKELANIKLFRKAFEGNEDVIIPRPYDKYCTSRVLTLQYVQSQKFTQAKGKERRKRLARQVMELFLKLIIEKGFIHADPHPGNLGVTNNDKIVMYDFGQVAKLDKMLSSNMKSLLFSVYDRDIEYITDMLIKSKSIILTNPTEKKTIIRLVEQILSYFKDLDFKAFTLSMIDDVDFGEELPFKVNPKLVMVFRALSILEGICKELDKEFSYFDVIDNLVSDVFLDMEYFDHKARKDFMRMFDDVSTQPKLDVIQETIEKNNKMMAKGVEASMKDYKILLIASITASMIDGEVFHAPRLALLVGLAAFSFMKK
jgi:predicted unusual protein kinase regulating ubiquinone biosynthesis (AarF/ABC1/UbiB family)